MEYMWDPYYWAARLLIKGSCRGSWVLYGILSEGLLGFLQALQTLNPKVLREKQNVGKYLTHYSHKHDRQTSGAK